MSDYSTVIEKMNKIVNDYHIMPEIDPMALNMMLKDITSALYYLETVRADIHNSWQIEVKQLIEDGTAVNRAENEAHVKYPELYLLRHLMSSAYEVVWSMRTNISFAGKEMATQNIG